MPILFDLPTDVALSILMDWLGDTKSLVALDSASARSIRWAYLGLVRDPRFRLSNVVRFCLEELSDIRFWICNRGVKIQALHVSSSPALKEAIRISYDCLSAVTILTVSCGDDQQADVECLRILLKLLPSLTSLNMAYFNAPNDDYLVVLSTMHHLRLRTLVLDDASQFSGNLVMVVQGFCSTLEVLGLGVKRSINAATLQFLGTNCNNLKDLYVTCVGPAPKELAAAFGAGKFPLLRDLQLRYYCRITAPDPTNFQDDFFLNLCTNHSNLESFYIRGDPSVRISLSSVAAALVHCPKFREMFTDHFQFETVLTAERIYGSGALPYFTLHILQPLEGTTSLRAALQSITDASQRRVREISSSAKGLTNDEVEAIVEAFGKHLYMLDVSVGDDVSHQTLERLILECTAVRKLHFNKCANFTDNLVILLADQCYHVQSLSLADAGSITNMSMWYLLERMGSRLQVLCIDQCSLLTSSTLIAIVEYCTLLETLDITGTGIIADVVIVYVIKPNRLLKLDELFVDQESITKINDFVARKENGANGRWCNVVDSY